MKGKGAQYNPSNPYLRLATGIVHEEGIDEYTGNERPHREIYYDTPKHAVSKNNSPDLKMTYSINAYQGCEHGCVYCYARNSHTYWGFSAGLDFESKIIVKPQIARSLEKQLSSPSWVPQPMMLSGNTDCYQPVERSLRHTREILEVLLKFRNPVSIVTKNALVTRDEDLLSEMASMSLVHVYFSINSLDEKLRAVLEPRTSTASRKLQAMEQLSARGIPVGIMNAPIIPGLNHHEIPNVIQAAANAGALGAGYTVVRLNGQVKDVFADWVHKVFPNRAQKVLNQIRALHGGNLNDTEWGRRIKGDGPEAAMIAQMFRMSLRKYMATDGMPPLEVSHFRRGGNYQLF